MILYLVRHGAAAKVSGEATLTPDGRDAVLRVARALRGRAAPGEIRHSAKLRARETAEILGTALDAPTREMAGLAPMDSVQEVADRLWKETEDLMLVSHLPFLDRLASLLTSGSAAAEAFEFHPGAALCLVGVESSTRAPSFRTRWMLDPDLLA